MAELARTIASRLRQFIGNRRRAKRYEIQLAFTVSLAEHRTNGARRAAEMKGHTLDVSATGLALVLPAIRIGEHYLAGGNRRLDLKLELPTGTINLEVVSVRYESLEEEDAKSGYIVGVHITRISPKDQARFNEFVKKHLRKAPASRRAQST